VISHCRVSTGSGDLPAMPGRIHKFGGKVGPPGAWSLAERPSLRGV
jgi:hypothetical protein